MITEPSQLKEALARLFVWAHQRGSALEAAAVLQFVAVLVAWVLGRVTAREVLDSFLAATTLWSLGALVRRSVP